jgi:acyl carrier protein
MDEMKQPLAKCFAVVFPDLKEAEIFSATQANVASWDSIAAITLVNVVEEEFNIQLDFEILPELTSFESILAHLKKVSHLEPARNQPGSIR